MRDDLAHVDQRSEKYAIQIGLGYYQRASDGQGYLVQDFGNDAVHPPIIINLESITTTTTEFFRSEFQFSTISTRDWVRGRPCVATGVFANWWDMGVFIH